MLRRNALPIGFVVLAVLAIGTIFVRRIAPPSCTSEQAMDGLSEVLRNQFQLGGIIVNNVETVSGWYFSDRHDCSAEFAEIKGNLSALGMTWRAIRFRVQQQDEAQRPVVTVEMGDVVPLAAKIPSVWKRFLAHF
jgi:hypothetical protein